MPLTEAGKRLLDVLGGTDDEDYQSPTANMIAAIEAEARAAGLAEVYGYSDYFHNTRLDALAAKVEGLDDGLPITESAWAFRAAVLALIAEARR